MENSLIDTNLFKSVVIESLNSDKTLKSLCKESDIVYGDLMYYIHRKLKNDDLELYTKYKTLNIGYNNRINKKISNKELRDELYYSIIFDCIEQGSALKLEEVAKSNGVSYSTLIKYIQDVLKYNDTDLYNKWMNIRTRITRYTLTLRNNDFNILLEKSNKYMLDTYNKTGEFKSIKECLTKYNKYNWCMNTLYSSKYIKKSELYNTYQDLKEKDFQYKVNILKDYYNCLSENNNIRKDLNKEFYTKLNNYDKSNCTPSNVGKYLGSKFLSLKRNKEFNVRSEFLDVLDLHKKAVINNDMYAKYKDVIDYSLDNNISLHRASKKFNISYNAITKYISRCLEDIDNELYIKYKRVRGRC